MQIRESNCLNCNAFEETDDGPYCEYKDEFITVDQVNGDCCDEWEPNDEELQSVLEQENADLRAKLAAAERERDVLSDRVAGLVEDKKKCELIIDSLDNEVFSLRANNAVLREALERINAEYRVGETWAITEYALTQTPSDSDERVRGLVAALEWWDKASEAELLDCGSVKVREALRVWRGDK